MGGKRVTVVVLGNWWSDDNYIGGPNVCWCRVLEHPCGRSIGRPDHSISTRGLSLVWVMRLHYKASVIVETTARVKE